MMNDVASEQTTARPTALVTLCKAGGHRLRVQILRVLKGGAYHVSDLCHIFSLGQSLVSHHLATLSKAELVTARRDGTTMFYCRAPQTSHTDQATMQQALFAAVDTCQLPAAIRRRMMEVRQQREQAARRFFRDNPGDVCRLQRLIAAPEDYLPVATKLLDLERPSGGTALEVGVGSGDFLPTLSTRFDHVIALDSAPQMLEQARQLAQQQGLSKLSFLCGDTRLPELAALQAEAVILNMVLHHNPFPARIIADCSRVLKPGAQLLISELCQHHQEWTRDVCGDQWLGFSAAEIDGWALQAGLRRTRTQYLGQRNGFCVQIRQFIRN